VTKDFKPNVSLSSIEKNFKPNVILSSVEG
jgi:hypothetical protein